MFNSLTQKYAYLDFSQYIFKCGKYVLIEPELNLLNHIVPLLKLRIQSVKLSVILDKVFTPNAFKISEFWVKSEISASLDEAIV